MAAPQQSGQDDHSTAILWMVAALFVTGGVIWVLYKQIIISAYLKIKLFEIDLLHYFIPRLADTKLQILTYLSHPDQVSFQQMVNVGSIVGDYLRFPFILILFILAFVVYYGNSIRTFKRTYSMRILMEEEKKNWPQITPVANFDLIKQPIDVGPWAMALTPIQFCKKYQLIEIHKQSAQLSRRERQKGVEIILKRGEANKLFALQLGSLWQDVNHLPLHMRALFAAFAARLNADTKPAQDLFRQINLSSNSKLDFRGADELLKKHISSKLVQKKICSHAYILTVMASMLEGAREDGVQTTAHFLFLKPIHTPLF